MLDHMLQSFQEKSSPKFTEIKRTYAKLKMLRNNLNEHPRKFYAVLCEALMVLSDEGFVEYQHHDLSKTFQTLKNKASHALNNLESDCVAKLSVKKENDCMYVVSELNANMLNEYDFVIEVFKDDGCEWKEKFIKQSKVGSKHSIYQIISSALPGVELLHLSKVMSRFERKENHEYFYINPNGDQWDEIKKDKAFVVFLSKDFLNASLDVLAVRKN